MGGPAADENPFLTGKQGIGCDLLGRMVVLNKNHDFRRIYAKGKYFVHPALVTYVMKNKAPGKDIDGQALRKKSRGGITASRKTGNAVKRNRAKRVIRQAYRELSGEIQQGWDIIFVARSCTYLKKSTEINSVMRAQLKAAGILK